MLRRIREVIEFAKAFADFIEVDGHFSSRTHESVPFTRIRQRVDNATVRYLRDKRGFKTIVLNVLYSKFTKIRENYDACNS